VQRFVADLNRLYRRQPALHEVDFDWPGFSWIDCHDAHNSIISFLRYAADRRDYLVVICNFTPMVREGYRLGVPDAGRYREVFNSDSRFYGGSDVGNNGGIEAEAEPCHQRSHSIRLTLPPLAVVVLQPVREGE